MGQESNICTQADNWIKPETLLSSNKRVKIYWQYVLKTNQ